MVNILGVIITTKTNYLLRVHGETLFRATSEAAGGIEKNIMHVYEKRMEIKNNF